MKKMLIFFLLFFVPLSADAEITFVEGKWETTFLDCADVSQPDNPNCDGITEWGGGWAFNKYILTDGITNNWLPSATVNEWYYNANTFDTFSTAERQQLLVGEMGGVLYDDIKPGPPYGVPYAPGELVAESFAIGELPADSLGFDTVYMYSTTDPDDGGQVRLFWVFNPDIADSYLSTITEIANNTSGGGGKGFRTIDGDGSNIDTSPLQVSFPSAQKEVWVRWYMRHELGYEWYPIYAVGGNPRIPGTQKHIYIYTSGSSQIASFGIDDNGIGDVYHIVAQNAPDATPVETAVGGGWTGIMDVPSSGGGGDGLWHCYEIHMKMNSAFGVADGEGRLWLDGVLKDANTSVDWSGTISGSEDGWLYFKVGENQSSLDSNGVVKAVDYDDIVVYNQTPPNVDAFGNPYIGPIGASPAPGEGISSVIRVQ